ALDAVTVRVLVQVARDLPDTLRLGLSQVELCSQLTVGLLHVHRPNNASADSETSSRAGSRTDLSQAAQGVANIVDALNGLLRLGHNSDPDRLTTSHAPASPLHEKTPGSERPAQGLGSTRLVRRVDNVCPLLNGQGKILVKRVLKASAHDELGVLTVTLLDGLRLRALFLAVVARVEQLRQLRQRQRHSLVKRVSILRAIAPQVHKVHDAHKHKPVIHQIFQPVMEAGTHGNLVKTRNRPRQFGEVDLVGSVLDRQVGGGVSHYSKPFSRIRASKPSMIASRALGSMATSAC